MINVPTEHCLFLKDSVKDKEKANRYWFQHLPEWRTSNNIERIIGIRSMWIPKSNRHMEFLIFLEKYKVIEGECSANPENSISINAEVWMDERDDLKKIWKDFKEQYVIAIEKNKQEFPSREPFRLEDFHMKFDILQHSTENRMSRVEVFYCTKYDPDNWQCRLGIGVTNNDTKNVLNYFDEPMIQTIPDPIIFYDVWDRHSCLVTSNISGNNPSNFLGFTHMYFNPIKYYKINSNDVSFYLDFWNAHDKDVMNIFPHDNKEDFNIEIVLLHNANQLY